MNNQQERLLIAKNAELEKELALKNRELEIEVALERLRSRMLRMQKSSELEATTAVMYQQLDALGVVPEGTMVYIVIMDTNTDTAIQWIVTDRTLIRPPEGELRVPMTEDPRLISTYEAWKRKDPLLIRDLSGEELEDFKKYIKSLPSFQEVKSEMDQWPDRLVWSEASFSKGTLGFICPTPLPSATLDILVRFSKDFDLTYTRFLDLQKAEAQARESEIELALERVRARTLAMHSSEELGETAYVLFQQMLALGVKPELFVFGILSNNGDVFDFWGTEQGGNQLNTQFTGSTKEPTCIAKWHNAVKEKMKSLVIEISGDDLKSWVKYLKEELLMPLDENLVQNKRIHSSGVFSKGLLIVTSPQPLPQEQIVLLERFAKVFEQTYTRFLDLQKAEAQTREAKIEAALEKVRSSSLSMHNSDQLRDIVKVVFEKLKELKFAIDGGAFVGTISKNSDYLDYWVGDDHAEYPDSFKIPKYDAPTITDVWRAKKSGVEFISKTYSIKEKNVWFEYAFNNTNLKTALPEDFKKWILEQEYLTQSFAMQKNSMVGVHFHHAKTLTENEIDILKRISRVFEQSYVRFLDLQKAEAQAREAQIEAALEKVRARSMAMHKSDELREVVFVFFKQLQPLGFSKWGFQLRIALENKANGFIAWLSTPEGRVLPERYHIPTLNHRALEEYWAAYEQQMPHVNIEVSGKDKRILDLLLFDKSDLKNLPKVVKQGILKQEYVNFSVASMRYGLLEAIDVETNYKNSDDQVTILKRFAKVFEQTYTRFLDLQKAEAQAREAQIEAALERVRSTTMAMHNSDELSKVVATVFKELQLSIDSQICILLIFNWEKDEIEWWSTGMSVDVLPEGYKIPLSKEIKKNGLIKRYVKVHKQVTPYSVFKLAGKTKSLWDKYIFEHSELKKIPQETKEAMMSFESVFLSDAINKFGTLEIAGPDPLSEEKAAILQRFSKVVEQTYTRFNDLKIAEAQAREAQIEAALERVRGISMAMQKSEELINVATVMNLEFQKLGITQSLQASFVLIDEEKELQFLWGAQTNTKLVEFTTLPLFGDHVLQARYEAWKRQEPVFNTVLGDENLKKHNEVVKPVEGRTESEREGFNSMPDPCHFCCGNFKYGYLFFISTDILAEEHQKIVARMAKVFEQTYTRFLDLQKAEAQAREAVKQASLDRVRGEIASMRTKDDLNRITPLIWKELNTLDVPFIRCGVFIMNENKRTIQTYLSTPDGRSLAAFEMGYDSERIAVGCVIHWNKKEIYQDHWDKKQFVGFMQNLIKTGQIKNTESFQGSSAPPESLDLHFLPFKQGMLYVGSTSPLAREELQLVQSLAESFSIAYARYEDFKQLEKAKNQTDEMLNELRAAQSQLIQSEKMASLGELTAGIAHEIQNPLNFVNNFSEVNNELIEELNDELNKGDIEEAKAISKDIKKNGQKINHHGKRAESIVKSMLEHSRTTSGEKEFIDINVLCDEYLRLAYHGLRAKDRSFNATFETDLDSRLPKIKVVPQDIGRVLLNLINNAFHATSAIVSAKEYSGYKPLVTVSTKNLSNENIQIIVSDNGPGIPDNIKNKIFQPFFTTKPTGQGTGLGLSLSYDIVKAHGGTLKVKTQEGTGSEFIIILPIITR